MSRVRAPEGPLGSSEPASVVADIGGEFGAGVLYVPETLAGREIEIRPLGSPWDGTHTGIRDRHFGGSAVWAAFFGSLAAGRYELRVRDDSTRSVELDIRGGEVTESRW